MQELRYIYTDIYRHTRRSHGDGFPTESAAGRGERKPKKPIHARRSTQRPSLDRRILRDSTGARPDSADPSTELCGYTMEVVRRHGSRTRDSTPGAFNPGMERLRRLYRQGGTVTSCAGVRVCDRYTHTHTHRNSQNLIYTPTPAPFYDYVVPRTNSNCDGCSLPIPTFGRVARPFKKHLLALFALVAAVTGNSAS